MAFIKVFSEDPVRLGNRTLCVNLVSYVCAWNTPVAPLGLLLVGSTCTIHLSPLRGCSRRLFSISGARRCIEYHTEPSTNSAKGFGKKSGLEPPTNHIHTVDLVFGTDLNLFSFYQLAIKRKLSKYR